MHTIHEFRLTNRIAELTRMHEAVESLPLPPRTMFNTSLVLDELLTNIIKYGLPPQELREIYVRLELNEEHLDIVIEDDGIEFNPLEAPDPDLELPIEERPIGGLGIFIVRKLSSSFCYERVDGGNHLAVRMLMNNQEAT